MNQMKPGLCGHHPGSGKQDSKWPLGKLGNDREKRIYQKQIVTGPHLQLGCIHQALVKAEFSTHLIYNHNMQTRAESFLLTIRLQCD